MATDNLEQLYQAVIGPKNQAYYLSQFSRLDEKWQSAYSWNWPVFFIGFPWLLYRKMWLHALVYFLLPCVFVVLTIAVAAFAGKFAGAAAIIAALSYCAIIFVWMPGSANRLYYRHCRRKVAKATRKSPQLQAQIARLSRHGGTGVLSAVFFTALAGAASAAAFGALYWIGITADQTFRAYAVGANASVWVGDYYSDHQILPESLAQAGFSRPLPASVKELRFDNRSGLITMTLAIPSLEGKTLRWTPSFAETLAIGWTCSGPDIPKWYLPRACRPRDAERSR